MIEPSPRVFRRLHRLLAPLAMLSVCLSGHGAHAGDPENLAGSAPVTVVVVRHAEKAADGSDDPGLSDTGEARALALAEALTDTTVAAIYTTQLRRTIATAAPLATQAGIEVSIRPIAPGEAEVHTGRLVEEILARHPGDTVVVVGHSNTVPLVVNALSGRDAAAMNDNEYDHYYLVSATGPGRGQVMHARYGAAGESGACE